MNKKLTQILGALVPLVIVSCGNDNGRYQMIKGAEIMVIDTKTGVVYYNIEKGDSTGVGKADYVIDPAYMC
jgi:hypothetical protein